MINILSLSTSDYQGGASIASYRITTAINKFSNQCSSKLLVARKYTKDESVIEYYNLVGKSLYFVKLLSSRKIQNLQKTNNKITHSGSYFPSRIHKFINYHNSDVVHLNWVQDEFLPISSIYKIRKPLVWTLHDSWPFCGTEHHPFDLNDKRYIEGYCNENRFMGGVDNKKIIINPDLDKFIWERKKQLANKKIYFVAPSSWMLNSLKSSSLFNSHRGIIIPNPVPRIFYDSNCISKSNAVKLLGLPLEKPILLFVANRPKSDMNKGWNLLKDILTDLSKEIDFHINVIGGEVDIQLNGNSSINIFKRINSLYELSLFYRSANVLLLPSILENLPQVATEAISSGTPVIAFKGSGTEDVVINKKTGYLIDKFDLKEFYKAIIMIIKKENNNFTKECISYSNNNWREELIAKKYADLFKDVYRSK